MAFRFRSRGTPTIQSKTSPGDEQKGVVVSKLTSAQLSQLAKLQYPVWLKDNTAVKQLPGVYQGVLGQVQLQPGFEEIERKLLGCKQERPTDYMNKFTDTERVHQLLSASQLPNETLATIWAHVNKTFPGKLTNREVCLALALIAIFQRLDKVETTSEGGDVNSKSGDPFSIVKAEKKPPVPILYSRNNNCTTSYNGSPIKTGMAQSRSTPENLSSNKSLLVDIFSGPDNDDETMLNDAVAELSHGCENESNLDSRIKTLILNNPMSLIDLDSDRFEVDFNRTTNTWFRFLNSMRGIFKRSFDILNVEHSRKSAIEALRSPRGMDFGRNLCLCYPLAHNIKQIFDQLNSIRLSTTDERTTSNENKNHTRIDSNSSTQTIRGIFDKRYSLQIDYLMTSINEYWAVLINLLHEAGRTEFIELIMDGLTKPIKQTSPTATTISDIASHFSARSDICCICHNKSYLDSSEDNLSQQLLDLVASEQLICEDKHQQQHYYYHPRCASFWLNQVDSNDLPFSSELRDQTILCPQV